MSAPRRAPAALTTREAIADLLQQLALRLDQQDWTCWLALFARGLSYEVAAQSSDLGHDVVWWSGDRADLELLLSQVHEHVVDPARRLHMVAPISIELADGERASTLSYFTIYRTPPGDSSQLYAVGRYEDQLVFVDGTWRCASRHVLLDTEMLPRFTHFPL